MSDETKKTILLELNIDTVKAVKNQKELKELLAATNKELQEAEIGTETYKKLEVSAGLLTKRTKELTEATKQSTSELEVQEGSLRDLQAQYNKLSKALREAKPGQDVLGQSFEAAKKKAKALKEEIKDFESQLGNHQSNVGNYVEAIKEAGLDTGLFGGALGNLQGSFGKVKQGLDVAKTGFSTLRGAIIATGIGALVLLLITLFSYFTKTNAGAKLLSQGLGAVSAVTSVLFDRLAKVGKAIIDLNVAVYKFVTGDFEGAAKAADEATQGFSDSVDNLGGALAKAASEGVRLAKAEQDLITNQRKLSVLSAERKGQIEVLQKSAENQLLSEKERIDNLRKAGALLNDTKRQEIDLAKQNLKNIQDKNKLSDASEDDLQKEAEAKIKVIELENERNNLLAEFANKESGLIKAIAAQRAAENAKRLEMLQKIKDAENSLFLFRKETEINILKEQAKQAVTTTDERLALIDEIRQKEISLEKDKTKILLENDKLLKAERTLIKEQGAENVRKIEQSSSDEILKINKDLAEKLKKAEQALSVWRQEHQIKENDLLISDSKRTSESRIALLEERQAQEIKLETEKTNVLLQNDQITINEKILLEEQLAARKVEIERSTSTAILAITDATEAERVAKIKKAQDETVNFANQAAQTVGLISTTRLNKELVALDKQKQQELRIAGNNEAEKKKIEEKFAAKRAQAEKEAAIRANEIAKVQAVVNTFQAVTKSLTSAPFPLNLVLAAGTAAFGFAQVAQLNSESDKLADGGFIKNYGKAARGVLIGGRSHAQGGTKFYGEDGTRFEAEKGELLAVVNKRDTPLLSMLSNINSIHGKSFFGDGNSYSSYLADGGLAARASSSPVVENLSNQNDILAIVSSLPSPIVTVEDINAGQGSRAKVVSRANI